MNKRFWIICAAFLGLSAHLFAQGERKDKTPVTYEELYDEPYSVNKLFVGLTPLYGELFVTNVNAGFGIDVSYYHKEKADFKAQFRKTYSASFFDHARTQATNQMQSSVDNRSEVFNYFELGGTYHLKDFESTSKTKMFLYKNSYKGNKWSARVPLNAEIPCKVRKIYGLRLGGLYWDSSTDLNRALEEQGLTNEDLKNVANAEEFLPMEEYNKEGNLQEVRAFTNVSSAAVYLGGSMAWIKNVAVSFDKFEEGVDDLILTVYADLIYAPSISVDDVFYTPKSINGDPLNDLAARYSVSPLSTKALGFRMGIDGKFNRQFSWSYGAEAGYRPSLEGRSFFVMMRVSFPVFGTNLDYKVESFGK